MKSRTFLARNFMWGGGSRNATISQVRRKKNKVQGKRILFLSVELSRPVDRLRMEDEEEGIRIHTL